MKKIVCLIAAIVMTASFFLSTAYAHEVHALTRQEAEALMDAFYSLEFDEAWECKEFQKENARRTREWEKEYGPHGHWQGNVTAAYVLAYGMMPTYDAPYADPLAALPGSENLPEIVARTLAMDAVAKVEDRLSHSVLESMESAWGFFYSRDLDWFWEPSGTWVFSWYSNEGKLACMAYVSDCEAKAAIVFDYLDRTPDDEGIHMFTEF